VAGEPCRSSRVQRWLYRPSAKRGTGILSPRCTSWATWFTLRAHHVSGLLNAAERTASRARRRRREAEPRGLPYTATATATDIIMSDCACHQEATNPKEKGVLQIALMLNAAMAVVEGIAGYASQSTGLMADALDMFSDATAYAIGLVAIGRPDRFKTNAAYASGVLLLFLGVGLLAEATRKGVVGSEPNGGWMIAVSFISLAVNVAVLRMLQPLRTGGVHLRATWIFTRADVVANIGVIISGALVGLLGTHYPDLIVGTLIGLYVIKEAFEILGDARNSSHA
jgi:Co/Zn/Cd efflux system component